MVADRDAGVDPRFDPVFQRGYDPATHRSSRRPASEAALAPRPEPKPVEPVGAEPTPEPVVPTAARAEPAAVPEPEPVASPRNPFRLALLLASVGAIAAAGVLFWRQFDDPNYYGPVGADVGAQFVMQFTDALTVPLLTGGVIGLVVWLAIGAMHRRDGAGR